MIETKWKKPVFLMPALFEDFLLLPASPFGCLVLVDVVKLAKEGGGLGWEP